MHGKLPLWALLAALLDVKSAGLFVSALSSTVDAVPHRHIRLGHGTGEYTGWGLLLAFFPKFASDKQLSTYKNINRFKNRVGVFLHRFGIFSAQIRQKLKK